MDALGWMVFLILGVPAAVLIVLNWLSFVVYLQASRQGHEGSLSFVLPYLCGIAGAVACLCCPWPTARGWAWTAPLIDPSIVVLLIYGIQTTAARFGGRRSPPGGPPSEPFRESRTAESDIVAEDDVRQ